MTPNELLDAACLYDLDFEPEIPCEATHNADGHNADWWVFWSCGCVRSHCDAQVRKNLARLENGTTIYCMECGVEPITLLRTVAI